MTDRNTISALLDSMAGILIAYEPGDVMNASAALSLAEKLRAACEGCDPADRICGRLVQLAKEALTGSFTDFTGPASAGADMLRYVTETGTGQLPESKKSADRIVVRRTKHAGADSGCGARAARRGSRSSGRQS